MTSIFARFEFIREKVVLTYSELASITDAL